MYKLSDRALTGNERYEGYAIELTQKLAELLHFKYEIKVVNDDKYGGFDNVTQKWNGMIKEILDGVRNITLIFTLVDRNR